MNMKKAKKIAVSIGIALCLGAQFAASQQNRGVSVTQTWVMVHIPPQPLREALRKFAEQTHLQVVYRSEQIDATAISDAVSGTYPAEEALALLLGSSSDLRINARTLAVHVASADHTPQGVVLMPYDHVGTLVDTILCGALFVIGQTERAHLVAPVETGHHEVGALTCIADIFR